MNRWISEPKANEGPSLSAFLREEKKLLYKSVISSLGLCNTVILTAQLISHGWLDTFVIKICNRCYSESHDTYKRRSDYMGHDTVSSIPGRRSNYMGHDDTLSSILCYKMIDMKFLQGLYRRPLKTFDIVGSHLFIWNDTQLYRCDMDGSRFLMLLQDDTAKFLSLSALGHNVYFSDYNHK